MAAVAQQRRSPLGLFPDKPARRLYDGIVEVLRVRHDSRRTEKAYVHWIGQYIAFHQYQRPRELAEGKTGEQVRHHIDESLFQRSLKTAVGTKRVTSRTLRHSFATHLLADGYDTAPFRNCSATRTFGRRRCTRTCSTEGDAVSAARPTGWHSGPMSARRKQPGTL
ncbi:MAG: phage integrase N-terminal SAM-like domain-containing protein [Planctomycetota bacterium]